MGCLVLWFKILSLNIFTPRVVMLAAEGRLHIGGSRLAGYDQGVSLKATPSSTYPLLPSPESWLGFIGVCPQPKLKLFACQVIVLPYWERVSMSLLWDLMSRVTTQANFPCWAVLLPPLVTHIDSSNNLSLKYSLMLKLITRNNKKQCLDSHSVFLAQPVLPSGDRPRLA